MYLPLNMKINNRLFIDCLRFMVVSKIKKHLFGLTHSLIWPSFLPSPSDMTEDRYEGQGACISSVSAYQGRFAIIYRLTDEVTFFVAL